MMQAPRCHHGTVMHGLPAADVMTMGPSGAEHTVPGKGKLCMVAASSVNQVGEACSYGGSGYRLRVSAVSARWSSRRLLQSAPATDCHGERCGCLWSFCMAPASGQGGTVQQSSGLMNASYPGSILGSRELFMLARARSHSSSWQVQEATAPVLPRRLYIPQ